MIGTNNTGHVMQAPTRPPPASDAVVDILRDRRPDTKILLLGIFPRDPQPDGKMRARNAEVNALIEELDDGEHVHYLNINDAFLDEAGGLSKEDHARLPPPEGEGLRHLGKGNRGETLCARRLAGDRVDHRPPVPRGALPSPHSKRTVAGMAPAL